MRLAVPGPPPGPVPCAFVIGRPVVTPADVRALCERLRALLDEDGAEVVVCDAGALAADVCSVDALARLRLVAGRGGRRLCLQGASDRLVELLALAGLSAILPAAPWPPSGPGLRGQAEQREQALGVEEVDQRGDAAT
jgi:STAS domain